jgi:glycerol-3-phosphate dehydrogenase subunit C
MAVPREGNLDAPTRHPVDWENPSYYQRDGFYQEAERIFDICHGCRRCVSLCGAFPTLFDLIDEGKSGEIDGVDRKDYWSVVDQCYLCDICYVAKCPYVPPHPWNVDFPHLMLRGKAIKFADGETRLRDRMLTSTDRLGKLATIPVVVQTVNWANRTPLVRTLMDKTLGVAAKAELPPFASHPFLDDAEQPLAWPVKAGALTPGRVAIFATCYVNYNEPGIGHDLVKILSHNQIPAVAIDAAVCCGMPKYELGDLDGVARLKDINIPLLAAIAREGHAILSPVPSCTLMFKQELPLLFPGDPDVAAVAAAVFDPFEYLVLRDRDGLLRKDFKKPLGKVSYQVPCHSRVQKSGRRTREVLEWIPDTAVHTVERCAGHDGTFGVKSEFYEQSMKIGRPVFRAMAEDAPDYISSDCPIAGRRIAQGMAEAGEPSGQQRHPLTLVRIAYGLE